MFVWNGYILGHRKGLKGCNMVKKNTITHLVYLFSLGNCDRQDWIQIYDWTQFLAMVDQIGRIIDPL